MAENNRNLGGMQNEESRQDQQHTGGRMSGQQGQESGRGSYGSNREEDLQQNTSVGGNQQSDRSNSQSSSLENDDMGSDRDLSSDRNSGTPQRDDRQDEYGSRTGSL